MVTRQENRDGRALLAKVFPNGIPFPDFDPEHSPFADHLKPCALLSPTEVCMLTAEQYACLQHFLQSIGEHEFAVADADPQRARVTDDSRTNILGVETTYSDLIEQEFWPATVCFSLNATWGLIISDNEFAVLAASEAYREHLLDAFRPSLVEFDAFVHDYMTRQDLPNHTYAAVYVNKMRRWISPEKSNYDAT